MRYTSAIVLDDLDERRFLKVGHGEVLEIHVLPEGVAVHRCEDCPYAELYPWHRVLLVEAELPQPEGFE